MEVLQVVTTASPFFRQQVDALESQGVNCTTVTVPDTGGALGSADAYRRFYQRVLASGLDSYDLVHANYGLTGPFALAQPTRPVVLTLWGSDVMSDSTPLTATSRLAASHSDAVIASSEPIAESLSVPHEVVPFAMDTDRFRPVDREQARDEVGWEPDGRVVLFPYHPDRSVKDYERADRIVASVDDRLDEPVELRWIWGVDHEMVPLYMNASDAVLVTSRRESGPMVVKEAAACNVPVVSTDVGFVSAVLDGVEQSTVADTDAELVDALVEILRADVRSDGRRETEFLTPERMGNRLVDLYRRVLTEA
ncbi:glycosyltransferase [Haloarchaeobius sp. FL176]|uniref:glycosyltransferase n=1 Tax=Haloarchaeobius sp. FL176 TaxID=2967129 RepID=UPI0021484CBD|nr:glycosyltransferase [Haloarchaeobius sp. FL176]